MSAPNNSQSSFDENTLNENFSSLYFPNSLPTNVVTETLYCICRSLRNDQLCTNFSRCIPCETFALREVMNADKLYEWFGQFFKRHAIKTPSTCLTNDVLVVLILVAPQGDQSVDKVFMLFRQSRKSIRQIDVYGSNLYGKEESRDTRNMKSIRDTKVPQSSFHPPLLPALSEDNI